MARVKPVKIKFSSISPGFVFTGKKLDNSLVCNNYIQSNKVLIFWFDEGFVSKPNNLKTFFKKFH